MWKMPLATPPLGLCFDIPGSGLEFSFLKEPGQAVTSSAEVQLDAHKLLAHLWIRDPFPSYFSCLVACPCPPPVLLCTLQHSPVSWGRSIFSHPNIVPAFSPSKITLCCHTASQTYQCCQVLAIDSSPAVLPSPSLKKLSVFLSEKELKGSSKELMHR